MAVSLQDWIHRFEEGGGSAIVRRAMVLVVLVSLAVFYNLAAFRNLDNAEGMDAAQLGRNLAEGKGFTTDFIRPLSLHLVYQRATNQMAGLGSSEAAQGEELIWRESILGRHPDLAHPPLYPLILAGVLSVNPFGYPEMAAIREFSDYKPDLWIAGFNQILFFVAIWLLFKVGQKLFDDSVAWVAAIIFAGCELYWRFTLSGLSTMVLIVIFLATIRVLAGLEDGVRDAGVPFSRLLRMALFLGLLTGLGMMTRYAYGWLVLPLAGMFLAMPHPRRNSLLFAMLGVFLLVATPWLIRNYQISGQPFGTTGYALFEVTATFPENELQRSVAPDFREFHKRELTDKLVKNLRTLISEDVPKMGGSWVTAFFLVGLLVPFRKASLGSIRFFLLLSLGLMLLVQALGKTWVSEDSPTINSDNLLAVLAPVIFVYGVSLFFMLMEQISAKTRGLRLPTMGVFCLVMALPLLLKFLPPTQSKPRIAYPPYYPPWIEEKASFFEPEDTMMSDIPWAVAWYGDRTAIWLSRDYRNPPATRYRNDFFAIHDQLREVDGLYISAKTLEKIKTESLFEWITRGDPGASWEEFVRDWGSFLLVGIFLNNEIPAGFPLKNAPQGLYPELFLVDSEHIELKSIQ